MSQKDEPNRPPAGAGGYMRRVLWVDLSSGTLTSLQPDERLYRDFIGGYGIGVRMIYERQPAGVDPLGPDNILGFATGPLTGVTPFSGRYMVVAKSPLTGAWGDANSGGFFGPALKAAGYDAVFFTGVAPEPVYLWLHDGETELRDARHLWGHDTVETEAALRAELDGHKIRVACIGPAGERQSRIAAIINDEGRAAARAGLGAVMGAKRLKALAVSGSRPIPVADRDALKAVTREFVAPLRQQPSRLSSALSRLMRPLLPHVLPWMVKRGISLSIEPALMIQMFREQGTSMQTALSAANGDSPVKNWDGIGARDFPMARRAAKISDQAVIAHQSRRYACAKCPVGCGGIMDVQDGRYPVTRAHKPEYETLAAFGTMCLNDDLMSIIKSNDICNRYGLDTISAGATIAFAIECYEAGILTEQDTDGLALNWGNAKAIVALLDRLARREGLGDVLADGVKLAAARIGNGAERFAMHAGGQELPMHDPKFAPSYGATYVTDPTPGRHTAGGLGLVEAMDMPLHMDGVRLETVDKYTYQGKGEAHARASNLLQVANCAGLCMFSTLLGDVPLSGLLNAVTGWACTSEELLATGARIQTLRQAFNVREGLTPDDFRLPARAQGVPPQESGPNAGVTIDVDALAEAYFRAMDWDPDTGAPSPERLAALGLSEVV